MAGPTLTFLAIDGSNGTLDDAFEAHVAPIRHWATALWDKWFTTNQMQHTLDAARRKLANSKGTALYLEMPHRHEAHH